MKIEINLSEGQVYMKLFTFLSRDIINKIHRDFFFIHSSLKRRIENFLVVSRQEKNYGISLKKKKIQEIEEYLKIT